jgi:hypothetical protein
VVGLKERAKKCVFRNARRIPFVAQKIASEVDKQRHELAQHFHKAAKGQMYIQQLPDVGLTEVKSVIVCLSNIFVLYWSSLILYTVFYLHQHKYG